MAGNDRKTELFSLMQSNYQSQYFFIFNLNFSCTNFKYSLVRITLEQVNVFRRKTFYFETKQLRKRHIFIKVTKVFCVIFWIFFITQSTSFSKARTILTWYFAKRSMKKDLKKQLKKVLYFKTQIKEIWQVMSEKSRCLPIYVKIWDTETL